MELTGICPVDDKWVMLRSSAVSMSRKVIVVFQGVLLRNYTVLLCGCCEETFRRCA